MADICLQNIVTVRDVCAGQLTTPSSGYDLMDAPEISLESLAAIAKPEYQTGLEMARKAVAMARLEIQNDFITALKSSGYAANILEKKISSGHFNPAANNPAQARERGITLYKNGHPSEIRKLKINTIQVYPLANATGAKIRFYDSGYVSEMTVDLVANQLNTFENVGYVVQGTYVRVLIDGTALPTASSVLTCMTTCAGAMPNDCGYVKGYNGTGDINKEGFGLNIEFSCTCDFTDLLCQFSRNYIGKTIWLKSRAILMEYRLETSRVNAFVNFGRDEAAIKRVELENEYRQNWNDFIGAFPELLKNVQSDCISCSGVRVVTNV